MDFKAIIKEYDSMLYHISLGYLRNKEDAEDVVQEVFLKYVKYVLDEKPFTDKKHEKHWLIRVTINLCCTELKNTKKNKKSDNDNNNILKNNALFDEIQKLNDNYKNVVILHYLEEFKLSEIGEILNISEDNVKTRLKRARQKLKKGLNIEE